MPELILIFLCLYYYFFEEIDLDEVVIVKCVNFYATPGTGIPRSWPYSMLTVSQVGRFEIETQFRSWPKMHRNWQFICFK